MYLVFFLLTTSFPVLACLVQILHILWSVFRVISLFPSFCSLSIWAYSPQYDKQGKYITLLLTTPIFCNLLWECKWLDYTVPKKPVRYMVYSDVQNEVNIQNFFHNGSLGGYHYNTALYNIHHNHSSFQYSAMNIWLDVLSVGLTITQYTSILQDVVNVSQL